MTGVPDWLGPVQWVLAGLAVLLLLVQVGFIRSAERMRARAMRELAELQVLRHDIETMTADVSACASFVLAQGGQRVADELERLVEKAATSADRLRTRRKQGDYGA